MNFCKDCKHFKAQVFQYCLSPDAKRDPVKGIAFTEFERSIIGNCGGDGKLFEPKPVKVSWFERVFG